MLILAPLNSLTILEIKLNENDENGARLRYERCVTM